MKIDVLEVRDEEDGGATVTFDMDEDTTNLFVRQGMRIALEELQEKYVVVPADRFQQDWVDLGMEVPEPRSIEMTSQELQGYFQIGVMKAIMDGIELIKLEKGEEKTETQLEFNFSENNDGC